ncbi:MAG: type II toxin-antitoxin system VapC family toxin [Candidatus Riflebacteria bacterium]|nr:type II toxin-antitoxin system VapC family toxin [Candidatus Riflebacteria bacterium]
MVLVDTDVLVDLQRQFPPAIAWLRSLHPQTPLGISGFSLLELMEGAANRLEMQRIRKALDRFPLFWPTSGDYRRAVATFARCRLSHHIGIVDVLIGETAVGLGVAIHTFNGKHLSAVARLEIVEPCSR